MMKLWVPKVYTQANTRTVMRNTSLYLAETDYAFPRAATECTMKTQHEPNKALLKTRQKNPWKCWISPDLHEWLEMMQATNWFIKQYETHKQDFWGSVSLPQHTIDYIIKNHPHDSNMDELKKAYYAQNAHIIF